MKVLFILLVMLNAGFFAWQYTREDPKFTAPALADSGDKSTPLVLLSEVDAAMARDSR